MNHPRCSTHVHVNVNERGEERKKEARSNQQQSTPKAVRFSKGNTYKFLHTLPSPLSRHCTDDTEQQSLQYDTCSLTCTENTQPVGYRINIHVHMACT